MAYDSFSGEDGPLRVDFSIFNMLFISRSALQIDEF